MEHYYCVTSKKARMGFWLLSVLLLPSTFASQSIAQSIRPANDGTGTIVNSPIGNSNQFNISGGTQAGANLFHSFQQFGLSQNQTATFLSNLQIQNILARVVGGNPSVINGLLQVIGSNSNLYLMNPSGIIFGANASLNVPASFTATTANGIGFNSNWFNAIGVNNYSSLTGDPSTFAFTMPEPGAIANLGNLSVGFGQFLTLLGGTVLSTGQLSAPGGQVTVAAVPGQNFVRVSQSGNLLSVELQPVEAGVSQLSPWTLPISSLPQLLTGGGIGNATGIKVNSNGTVQLTGSGIIVQPGKATVINSNQIQISNVFENSVDGLDAIGTKDEFGTIIVRFDNAPAPISNISTDILGNEAVLALNPSISSNSETECVSVPLEGLSNNSNQPSQTAETANKSSFSYATSSVDESKLTTEQLFRLGNQQYYTRQYKAALTTFQKVLPIYQTSQNSRCVAESLYWIGNTYRSLEQYSQAIASYQQALSIQPANGDISSKGRILNNLGAAYQLTGQYTEALAIQQQALAIRKHTSDLRGEGNTLSNIGAIYGNLGKYPDALDAYQQALTVFQTLGDRQAEGDVLNNVGLIYDSLGQSNKALGVYQQVLAIRQETRDRSGESSALHNIGLVYRHLGQFQQALIFYQQALAIRRETNDLAGIGETSGNIGDISNQLGQYAQAIDVLKQALEISQTLGRRDNEADILDAMAIAYQRLGQPSQAFALYQQALVIQQSVGNRAIERRLLNHLGDLYNQQHQPEVAIVFYKQSINVSESIRKEIRVLTREQQESYTQTVAKTYRTLADLLLSQGRILEAQRVLELLKIEEIREFTRNANVGSQMVGIEMNSAEEKILKEHGTLIAFGQQIYECKQTRCSQLSHLNDQLQELTQQYNQTTQSFAQDIRQRRAEDEAFLDPNKLLLKSKAIVEAQPGTVLIYPLVLKNKIWLIWAAKGGVIKSVQIPVSERQLGETVLKFRQILQSPISSIKEAKLTGKILYDWLIKPIEPELKANRIQNLVFSLDRVTRYIPMSALFDGSQYLVENYTISTILSADLTDMSDRSSLQPQGTPVLAAGVSEAVANFSPLPNVPVELNAIVKNQNASDGIYSGSQFLNRSFNFRTLRDNLIGHKIVHIATHAQFVPGRPENSFLVLGTGEKLTIPEIQTLQDLSEVQLVVLSACETALGGPDQDGIEISGISSYFLNAGAKAVMASLWTVDDISTSELMRKFYSNLSTEAVQKQMTKSQALRQAQLSLLYGKGSTALNNRDRTVGVVNKPDSQAISDSNSFSNFSHPYFWAPFILIGNGL